jgi:class 3 adenylate cyclase
MARAFWDCSDPRPVRRNTTAACRMADMKDEDLRRPGAAHAFNVLGHREQGMIERNADVPDDRRICFRVGINLGDVIVDDKDLYGDAVNIAARLENLADPGSKFSAH